MRILESLSNGRDINICRHGNIFGFNVTWILLSKYILIFIVSSDIHQPAPCNLLEVLYTTFCLVSQIFNFVWASGKIWYLTNALRVLFLVFSFCSNKSYWTINRLNGNQFCVSWNFGNSAISSDSVTNCIRSIKTSLSSSRNIIRNKSQTNWCHPINNNQSATEDKQKQFTNKRSTLRVYLAWKSKSEKKLYKPNNSQGFGLFIKRTITRVGKLKPSQRGTRIWFIAIINKISTDHFPFGDWIWTAKGELESKCGSFNIVHCVVDFGPWYGMFTFYLHFEWFSIISEQAVK